MKTRCAIAVAALLVLTATVTTASIKTFSDGKWSLGYDDGRISISRNGKELVANVAFGFWQLGYRGVRMSDRGMNVHEEEAAVVFSKTNEDAVARLVFTLRPDRMEIDFDLDVIRAPGPVEYSLLLPYASYVKRDGLPFARLQRNFFPIGTERFQAHAAKTVSFDLPEAHYEFHSEGEGDFVLEDKRTASSNLLRLLSYVQVDVPRRLRYRHVLVARDDFAPQEVAQRAHTLSCPPVFVRTVSFANGGFEEGIGEWAVPRNARRDERVSHSGKASVALTVGNPTTDCVYVTHKLPVVGGAVYDASCFVKTEGVKPVPGRYSPVGAGLILEWLDKDGGWMAPGDYACGIYGTSDWQLARTKSVKAPDSAGFAQVFLTLRGTGRAWFDDVALRVTERAVELLEPAPGVELACNTPLFSWIDLPTFNSYVVELSQDSDFRPDRIRSYKVIGRHDFRLTEPLERGLWYWRVRAPGVTNAIPRAFRQTAAKIRDCLPPQILTSASRIAHAHEAVVVKVKDDGGTAPTVTLGDVRGCCRLLGANVYEVTFVPTAKGWPKGFAECRLEATDAAGNRESQSFWLLNAPKPVNAVCLDNEGRYAENGKAIYPLGIYEVAAKDMPEVREAGFDLVHTYRWEGSQDDADCKRYLDACRSNGLRAFIGFDRGVQSGNGIVQGNFASVARRVGALADHPALFCWYLFDEPEIQSQYVSADRLTAFADLVRTLDPYHPVVVTTWTKSMINYRGAWDTHWTQAYGDPLSVVRQIDEHRRFLRNGSPITLIVNSNDDRQGAARLKGVTPDPLKYERDYDYLRACAFLGIVKSCNGVMWWWFARDSTDGYYTVAQCPQAWASLTRVVREIADLRPLITADGEMETGSAADGGCQVEWLCKTVLGKTVLVAVNTGNAPVKAMIKGQPMAFRRYEVKVITLGE